MSIEIILLAVISLFIGIGVVQQERGSIVGLMILVSINTIGMLTLIVTEHHVTMEILIVTISGMLLGGTVGKLCYMIIIKNKSQNENIKPQSPIDREWVKRDQERSRKNLQKKYPERFPMEPKKPIKKDLGEFYRKNFQDGLANGD